jgi:hypothetical protein
MCPRYPNGKHPLRSHGHTCNKNAGDCSRDRTAEASDFGAAPRVTGKPLFLLPAWRASGFQSSVRPGFNTRGEEEYDPRCPRRMSRARLDGLALGSHR